MKPKVYIDGQEGTTGLQIHGQLAGRTDIELLLIDEAKRKDEAERKKYFAAADLVFLCLPDAAARETVPLVEKARIIDASTAHRTAPGWVYGFPELSPAQRGAIREARFTANPGCHASGVIALIAPLTAAGLVPADYPLTITSLSAYSGAGKAAIAQYESPDRPAELDAPRLYAMTMTHKHIPEITLYSGLAFPPAFTPVICDYYRGMEVIIPLYRRLIKGGRKAIFEALQNHYAASRFISVTEGPPENGYLPSSAFAGTNKMELRVSGSDEVILLTSRFDNLGKGASGAAIQNMNLMLGFAEDEGLNSPCLLPSRLCPGPSSLRQP